MELILVRVIGVIGMVVSAVHTGHHVSKLLVVSWQGILAVLSRVEIGMFLCKVLTATWNSKKSKVLVLC